MRRSLVVAAVAAVLPLSTALGQQQPQPRFETVARTEEGRTADQSALAALRAQAADSAVRYAGVARRQRSVERALYVGGAALVAGAYAHWLGGPAHRGMGGGGAALLGAGLGTTAYGLTRRDAADRAATTSARWREVAAGGR